MLFETLLEAEDDQTDEDQTPTESEDDGGDSEDDQSDKEPTPPKLMSQGEDIGGDEEGDVVEDIGPLSLAHEQVIQLKSIRSTLGKLSNIAFTIPIIMSKESIAKKRLIEERIADAISLYSIMVDSIKEIRDKVPELIKKFQTYIKAIHKALSSLIKQYGPKIEEYKRV